MPTDGRTHAPAEESISIIGSARLRMVSGGGRRSARGEAGEDDALLEAGLQEGSWVCSWNWRHRQIIVETPQNLPAAGWTMKIKRESSIFKGLFLLVWHRLGRGLVCRGRMLLWCTTRRIEELQGTETAAAAAASQSPQNLG